MKQISCVEEFMLVGYVLLCWALQC